MPVQERRQRDLRVLNFAILGVVFKRQHGSEGVNSQSLSERERERERDDGFLSVCLQENTNSPLDPSSRS